MVWLGTVLALGAVAVAIGAGGAAAGPIQKMIDDEALRPNRKGARHAR
jgi:hypothetical protein